MKHLGTLDDPALLDALATMAPRRSLRRARVEVKAGCESPYVCYAAKPNAWVIRSNGTLSKCTVGFEDPRNDVGRVSRDGSFDLGTDRRPPWTRGWTTGDRLYLQGPEEGRRLLSADSLVGRQFRQRRTGGGGGAKHGVVDVMGAGASGSAARVFG